MLRLWIFVLMIGLVVLPVQAQDEDLPPYLYYYSDVLNAFVIERADGTDSRVLGEGLMPRETDTVGGPGWSPTGQWFAWRSSDYYGEFPDEQVWLIEGDGSKRIDFLDHLTSIWDAEWSPVEDILFVTDIGAEEDIKFSSTVSTHSFYLINAQTEKIITSFQMETSLSSRSPVKWTADGQYVFFFYTLPAGEQVRNITQRFMRIVSREGEIIDRELEIAVGGLMRPKISNTGWFLGQSVNENKLIIENIYTQEKLEIEIEGDLQVKEWSVSGNYALLSVAQLCGEYPCPEDLWLLSIADQSLEKIAPNPHTPIHDNWTGWFFWSSIQDVALYQSNGEAFLLEVNPRRITNLSSLTSRPTQSAIWRPSGSEIFLRDLSSITEAYGYLYNISTRQMIERNPIQGILQSYAISADGRYTVINTPPLTIIDDQTQASYEVRIHSDGRLSGGEPHYVDWQPKENWVILAEKADRENSDARPMLMSVTNPDGSIHRELGGCNFPVNCAEWLPEQVDIGNLASGSQISALPNPTMTIKFDGWVNWVSWSPDGKLVAVLRYGKNGLQMDMINFLEQEIILTIPIDDNIYYAQWIKTEDSYTIIPSETGESVNISGRGGQEINHFNADGSRLITWENRDYKVINTDTNERLFWFKLPSNHCVPELYSPDETLIAGRGYGTCIWNAEAGEFIKAFTGLSQSIDFSPDSNWLVAAQSTRVLFWKLDEVLNDRE